MAALGFLDFYVHIDVFLLIMVRLLAFLIILPVLSGTNIPMVSKVASAFVAACVVYSSGKAVAPQYTGTVIGYIYPALQEFLVGFTLGYAVYLAFSALNFAGQIIDFQIGFSMMSVFDPLTQVQAPIIGNLLTFAVSAILVQTGGLNAFLGAVFYSYEVLPLGSAVALGNAALAQQVLAVLGDVMIIAVRIALPVSGAIFILDLAMGLLVKAVPQMNVFVVGMPVKVLAGLALLIVLMPLVNAIYSLVFGEGARAMMGVIRGLSP